MCYARSARVDVGDELYHIINRSNGRSKIFNTKEDYGIEGARRAFMSLVHWHDYLFTYLKHPGMPNTTNTCDRHFSHIKDIVRIHRGLAKSFKQKVLDAVFLESTIAPKNQKK